MHCVLAVEKNAADAIKENVSKIEPYTNWQFDVCDNARHLDEYGRVNPDVLVLSRFLPGDDPVKLLKEIKLLFSGSHIVLLVGTVDETCKGYLRLAHNYGLNNYVTGKLPGDRPYNLLAALTHPRDPSDESFYLQDSHEPENPLFKEEPKEAAPEIKTCESAAMKPENPAYETPQAEYRQRNTPQENNWENAFTGSIKPKNKFGLSQPPSRPFKRRGYQGGYNRGNIILTAANKGGVGKSTTAITIAIALAGSGIEVILVDLNLAGPSIHNFFDLKCDRGIEALAGGRLILLDQVLINAPGSGNLAILPGPMDKTVYPDRIFEQGELSELFDTLATMAQVVIVDTPSNFWDRPWIPEVFEMADMVLAVVDQSKFSEMDTRDHAPKILSMGVNPDKIKIVLNRFSPRLHNARVVEQAFNDMLKDKVPKKMLPRVMATIPADWDQHNLMSYKGKALGLDDPLSQWHKLAGEITNLIGLQYSGPSKITSKKRGLFGFLKRG